MKKLLLVALVGASTLSAPALSLPTPVLVGETENEESVGISWTFESDDVSNPLYHVIVYKMHKAAQDETFVLAKSDFSHITSTGTMKKHEDRGAPWDYVNDCPGWYVKAPLYMDKAMGIDAFFYFAGSDNDDIFGGAYMVSPDYDLTGLSNPEITIKSELANEAVSVKGGYVLYTWNTDWWNEENIDYKPLISGALLHEDLSNESWRNYTDVLVPDEYMNRTRIAFYCNGYSAFWINSFEASVRMKAGETVTYAAEMHVIEDGSTKFNIDRSGDTENDYVYAYQVLAARQDYDDYRNINYLRFMSEMNKPYKVIGQDQAGIGNVIASGSEVSVRVEGGDIVVLGADSAEVFALDGTTVYSGSALAPISIEGRGIYLVRAGEKTVKVVL